MVINEIIGMDESGDHQSNLISPWGGHECVDKKSRQSI